MIELPDLPAERDFERLGEAYRLGLEVANHRAVRALASGAVAAAPASPDELRDRITERRVFDPARRRHMPNGSVARRMVPSSMHMVGSTACADCR